MKELWLLIIMSKHGGKAVLSGLSSWRDAKDLCCLFFLKDGACFSYNWRFLLTLFAPGCVGNGQGTGGRRQLWPLSSILWGCFLICNWDDLYITGLV